MSRSRRHRNLVAWTLVLTQGVLLVALAVWPVPQRATSWLPVNLAGVGLSALGLGVVVVGSTQLGSSLTASPVPKDVGVLRDSGLYAVTRHPLYSGLLLFAVGRVLSHPSFAAAGLALGLLLLLWAKASWEERMLRQKFPQYAAYALRVPRFVPRPSLWRASRSP
ncbi:isoprenylcysteine carboxylmethyltransferase family protein [Sanguibacter sp. 25GB23B1]|uniref:methyltransferase family protein n=1 Tax=unclassified Sanguibacter TaxID=2645534 RepID=UPI0032AF2D5E